MGLSAKNLGCARGDLPLFMGLDLEAGPGDAVCITGSNGSGKTSLLRLLCGLSRPAAGEVSWEGRDIHTLGEEYRAKLIYIGHAGGLKDDLLAWENLRLAAALSGVSISRDEACAALERAGLGRAAELPTLVLSQGQRKRVALARLAFGAAKPLWLLDEPLAALDALAVAALREVIDAHLARGGVLVYATHEELPLKARRKLHIDLDRQTAC